MAGMFGDFAAAHEFHQAVSQAHTHHTNELRATNRPSVTSATRPAPLRQRSPIWRNATR
ncbi:hypothetical protein I553_0992 [Mycobacterium xenopi 4042]|uniref:Uncharacterized protein n=1 Tax=Mycobacterium xenopi 4042 TaxID=1299334 RepID=X7Z928_MYCXE|nr:hypothetical protein I553_0992 [Mycobacterium xenopi 4042]